MANLYDAGPTVALAIDDKGAHVKLDRRGGASGYLFLNNVGASGVVPVDFKGVRRIDATVAHDGNGAHCLAELGLALPPTLRRWSFAVGATHAQDAATDLRARPAAITSTGQQGDKDRVA